MTDDFQVDGRSTRDIASTTLAWRDALGVAEQWAPSVVNLLELRVPGIIRDFALVVRPDNEMGDAEAYTEFDPPHIAVRGSVYAMAQREDPRSRMTFAHELGHLVMHPGAAKLRAETTRKHNPTIKYYESAEWQARKFASLFLVPDHIAIQFGSAHELAECCKISAQAAEIRYKETAPLRNPKPIPDCIARTLHALRPSGDSQ